MAHCLDKQTCVRVLLYGQIAGLIGNGQAGGIDRYGEVVAGDGHIAARGFEPALIAACISKSEGSGETFRLGGRNRCGCLDRFRAVLFRNQLIGDGLAAVAAHCLGIERQRAVPDGIGLVRFINAIPHESRNSRSIHNKGQRGTVLCNSRAANNSVILVGVIAERHCACRSRELIVLCGLQYDFAIVFRSCSEGACRVSAAIVRIPVDAVHGIAAADSRSAGSGSSGCQRRAQPNGGTGDLRYHRRFAHHQLDDMLVAENADGAAVLIQIQLQIIGIDLGGYARRDGDRMRGFIGSDGICLLYCSRTGDIMLARGSIGIARIYQFTRQRIPLEFEGMRRAVVHPLNGALPVLGVVDGVAVQRDGLHTPCVGDDSDGVGGSALQPHFIIFIVISGKLFRKNGSVSIGTGKDSVLRNNCAVAKAFIQPHRNIGISFRFMFSIYTVICVKVYCALKGAAIQTVRHIKARFPRPVLQINVALKGTAVHCNSRIRIILLCCIQHLHILLEGAFVDLNRAVGVLISAQLYMAVKLAAVNDDFTLSVCTQSVRISVKIFVEMFRVKFARMADSHAFLDRNIAVHSPDCIGIRLMRLRSNGKTSIFQR